jgi:MoaA/NifB/PqqE/SkfB family radical SAM enzyme
MSIIANMLNSLLATTRLPYPRTVCIEPVSNMCQLQCPLCPTGAGKLSQDCVVMRLETFKTILGKMPFVRTIELYKAGEPFLNPDIFSMIKFSGNLGIKVTVSSHFSFAKSDIFFESIVTSGLGKLVVSLDGASQETYSRYRIGGNHELVLSNMRKLVQTRERLRSQKPEIVWQFLVNRFNEHEIPLARKMAEDLKVSLDIRPFGLSDDIPDVEMDETIQQRKDYWLPTDASYVSDYYKGEYSFPLNQGPCAQLFTRLVVTASGKILPCCEVWDDSSIFGDLLTDSFDDIWYGRKYLDARSLFLKSGIKPQFQSVCFRCQNYCTTPSLKEKIKLLIAVYRRAIRHP